MTSEPQTSNARFKTRFRVLARWSRPLLVFLSLGFTAWFFYAVYAERNGGNSTDRMGSSDETSKRLRTEVRSWFQKSFPASAARAAENYGIFEYATDENNPVGSQWVFLAHGLDEPGNLWANLAPTLAETGYRVLEFRYPNDQSIQASSEFVRQELSQFLADPALETPPEAIHLIGHSMGGFVLRNFITHPDLLATCAWTEVSPVKVLIQLGTPNHGSWLAAYRLPAELRDHLFKDYGVDALLGMIWDGTGQAQIDLKPQSAFLESLNQRPFPDSIYWVGIAGTGSPVDVARLHFEPLFKDTYFADSVGRLNATFPELFNGTGDGCVSVESLRCDDMDVVYQVDATHRNMVCELGNQVPPAIPIILDILSRY